MANVFSLSWPAPIPYPSFHWEISQGFGDQRCKFCEWRPPPSLVPSPASPLQPCSSLPCPHPRSGARNRQMSTFPGAVRSGLLGDRDNRVRDQLSSGRVRQLAQKRGVLAGVGAPPTHPLSFPARNRAPVSAPWWGRGAGCHPGRGEAAPTTTHSKTQSHGAHPGQQGEGTCTHAFTQFQAHRLHTHHR